MHPDLLMMIAPAQMDDRRRNAERRFRARAARVHARVLARRTGTPGTPTAVRTTARPVPEQRHSSDDVLVG